MRFSKISIICLFWYGLIFTFTYVFLQNDSFLVIRCGRNLPRWVKNRKWHNRIIHSKDNPSLSNSTDFNAPGAKRATSEHQGGPHTGTDHSAAQHHDHRRTKEGTTTAREKQHNGSTTGQVGKDASNSVSEDKKVQQKLFAPRKSNNTDASQKDSHFRTAKDGDKSIPFIERIKWKSFIDAHNYSYLINPIDACRQDIQRLSHNMTLLVLVLSAPRHFRRRYVIRNTWVKAAHSEGLSTKTFFLLGAVNDQKLQDFIEEESTESGDIIQEDFEDSYLNLSIKTTMGLKWASSFCGNANFVMKTDDDVMLNIYSLVKDLSEAPLSAKKGLLVGSRIDHSRPFRNKASKWYTPERIFPGNKTYPPYIEGHGYIMSSDVVKQLYKVATTVVPLFPWEDVFIGMLAEHLGLEVLDLPASSFSYYCLFGVSNVTQARYLRKSPSALFAIQQSYFSFDLGTQEMRDVWSALERGNTTFVDDEGACTKKFVQRHKRLPDMWKFHTIQIVHNDTR